MQPPRNVPSSDSQHATVEIRLETAERLARQDPKPHGDERPGLRIEHAMRARDADETVADVAARVADRALLRIAWRGRDGLLVQHPQVPLERGRVDLFRSRELIHLPR